ncbi:unnamed protein product [Toxocara canis]|uniref:PDR_CDR domain-containing protein n=1 Tax=Toxocara canis TaxID=6265 RepID=A0A183UGJ8_TOXCA|nr:unnamed protein product [Toxocara canis]
MRPLKRLENVLYSYHIVPLGADDGLGMSAKEYWKSKNLDKGSDKRTQEGQFICIEPEPRSGNSMLGIVGCFLYSNTIWPRFSHRDIRDYLIHWALFSELFVEIIRNRYFAQWHIISMMIKCKRKMLFKRRQLSRPDVAARASLSTSVKDVMERSSHENTTFGQFVMKPAPSVVNKLVAVDEEESDEALRSVTLCKCQLSLESKRYFWQSAAAMRAFCYGFILALIPMGIIALKKSHA